MNGMLRRIIGLSVLLIGVIVSLYTSSIDTTDYSSWQNIPAHTVGVAMVIIWVIIEFVALLGMTFDVRRSLGGVALGSYAVTCLVIWTANLPELPPHPIDTLGLIVVIGWPIVNLMDLTIFNPDF